MDKSSLRQSVIDYTQQTHGATPEYPWHSYPNYAVLRHPDNRKWFGVIMDVPANRLDLDGDSIIDALNVKCDPDLVQSLIHDNPGFRPAYHMNKQRWVSILLDGSVDMDNIRTLIDTSYDLTTK